MTISLLLLSLAFQQEATLSLGVHSGENKSNGMTMGANYAVALKKGEKASLFGEVHFVASPNRKNNIVDPRASRDEATLFLTPGLRVSFLPQKRLAPFAAGGFGLGAYEQSQLLQNGDPFPGSRVTKHGAWHYGGGMDVATWKWLAFRGEIRNFYAAGRHNPIASVGFQVRFGKR